MAAKDMQRGWLTVAEAAKYVGVSESLIRGAINSHELEAYERPAALGQRRERRQWRVLITDIDRWVKSTWELA